MNTFNENKSPFQIIFGKYSMIYTRRVDSLMIYRKQRWLFTAFILMVYLIRFILLGGFYVVSYLYGLYCLHLLIQFATPKDIPDITEDENDEPALPSFISDNKVDSKPLLRQLDEFKLWKKITIWGLISLFCCFQWYLDIPVNWQFLFGYFFLLVFITIKRQHSHMKKYNYSWADFYRKNKN